LVEAAGIECVPLNHIKTNALMLVCGRTVHEKYPHWNPLKDSGSFRNPLSYRGKFGPS
jgi:hypothetical protein